MKKKVVVLGGGTGLSYLLKGLKDFPLEITAVITVSDNGRSTGILRKEFNIPAVGDIRHVITSISEIDQPIKDMLEYRFNTTSDLNGHKVGNLVLTAMLNMTGSLKESICSLSKLLDVKHKVLPVSEDPLTLMGRTINNEIIEGEEEITKAKTQFKKIYYKEEPHVLPEVITAIINADLIVLSMGSLYTSILPNIICKEINNAITKSKAKILYTCNAMTQPGETDNYGVSDHLKLLNMYLKPNKIAAVIASNTKIDEKVAKKYETEEQKDPVYIDRQKINEMKVELIEGDLLQVEDGTLRHNSLKLSALIFSYLMRD